MKTSRNAVLALLVYSATIFVIGCGSDSGITPPIGTPPEPTEIGVDGGNVKEDTGD